MFIQALFSEKDIIEAEQEAKFSSHFKDLNGFFKASPVCKKISEKIPFLKEVFIEQNKKGLSLQPAIIYEAVVVASFAVSQNFSLKNFDPITRSYIRLNSTEKIIQQGAPNKNDFVFQQNDCTTVYEIKKEIARAGERDLKVGNNGEIVDYNGYLFCKEWLDTINIFESAGHNIALPTEFVPQILKSYLHSIDYVVTFLKNHPIIAVIPVSELTKFAKWNGSEVRTTGKNWVKTKTATEHLLKQIALAGGVIHDGVVKIPSSVFEERTLARGKKQIYSNWRKIFNFFRIRDEDLIFENSEEVCFLYKDIQQNKPTISVHINIDQKRLLEAFNEHVI